jgi:cytochrome c556
VVPRGVQVKKLTAVVLLLFVGAMLSTCVFARPQTPAQTRAYKKAARKAQKDMMDYSKQQQKAMRKSAKAQRKALKQAQRRNHL